MCVKKIVRCSDILVLEVQFLSDSKLEVWLNENLHGTCLLFSFSLSIKTPHSWFLLLTKIQNVLGFGCFCSFWLKVEMLNLCFPINSNSDLMCVSNDNCHPHPEVYHEGGCCCFGELCCYSTVHEWTFPSFPWQPVCRDQLLGFCAWICIWSIVLFTIKRITGSLHISMGMNYEQEMNHNEDNFFHCVFGG